MSALRERSNIIIYERKLKAVNKNTNEENEKNQGENFKGDKKYNLFHHFKINIIDLISGVAILAVWWAVHDLPSDISELKESNGIMQTRLDSMETRLDLVEENQRNLNTLFMTHIMQGTDIAESNKGDVKKRLLASEKFSIRLINFYSSENNESNSKIVLEETGEDEIIGTDIEDNTGVTKESMIDEPFIMTYKENGEDVFFYGQYDENNQWNGECIINRYKNSKLSFIMDAFYDGGKLTNYKQVFKGENFQGQEIWYVSDRAVEENENSGETTTYFFYGDCIQNFDITTIESKNILSVENFLEMIPSMMEGYYNGYTSDGKYNDDSGNAYLVKYKPDGDVRYLYKGKIKNGVADDDSGNAWEFSWGYANDGYHYHKGKFSKGEPKNTTQDWLEPKGQDFIDSIVNPKEFNCPLTGLINQDL